MTRPVRFRVPFAAETIKMASFAKPLPADAQNLYDNYPLDLKVVTQAGTEIFFKCKQTTPLSKLMNAFCQRQGINAASVRFLFDGQRLNPQQTPQELEMEDGDVVDVMVEQQGC